MAMNQPVNRRVWVLGALAAGVAPWLGGCGSVLQGGTALAHGEIQEQLAALERSAQGRLGVAALDLASGSTVLYRSDERFAMCSTFKMVAVAAVLHYSMHDDSLMAQQIVYDVADLVSYSPVTEKHAGSGMSVAQLCAAALQYSDNTAANLLVQLVGGPQAVTAFARSVGDEVFRLDRWEPELNSAIPGDERDTTSPLAMMLSTRKLLLGDALGEAQRAQLQDWMRGNAVGGQRIRAGVPPGWIVADKTGSGAYGVSNDVGVLWTPQQNPLVLVVFFTRLVPDAKPDDTVVAQAARLVTGWLHTAVA